MIKIDKKCIYQEKKTKMQSKYREKIMDLKFCVLETCSGMYKMLPKDIKNMIGAYSMIFLFNNNFEQSIEIFKNSVFKSKTLINVQQLKNIYEYFWYHYLTEKKIHFNYNILNSYLKNASKILYYGNTGGLKKLQHYEILQNNLLLKDELIQTDINDINRIQYLIKNGAYYDIDNLTLPILTNIFETYNLTLIKLCVKSGLSLFGKDIINNIIVNLFKNNQYKIIELLLKYNIGVDCILNMAMEKTNFFKYIITKYWLNFNQYIAPSRYSNLIITAIKKSNKHIVHFLITNLKTNISADELLTAASMNNRYDNFIYVINLIIKSHIEFEKNNNICISIEEKILIKRSLNAQKLVIRKTNKIPKKINLKIYNKNSFIENKTENIIVNNNPLNLSSEMLDVVNFDVVNFSGIDIKKLDMNINVLDYLGNTALHYAYAHKNDKMIDLLKKCGADSKIVNFQGFKKPDYKDLGLSPNVIKSISNKISNEI